MQRGTIRKYRGAWTLYYRDDVLVDGQRLRKLISKKLASVSDEYPTKRSVLLLADKILAPLNSGTQVAESTDGRSLQVRRSVWRTTVNDTKTASSEASVPVLPILQRVLNDHRNRVNGHGEGYIFAGERRGTPLNLANLARRVIIPALAEYADEIQQVVPWYGWHSFRSSLATLLLSCGTEPRLIMAILRHSDISMTLNIYAQVPNEDARQALQKIEELMGLGASQDVSQLKMSESSPSE